MGDVLERENFHTKKPKTFTKIIKPDSLYSLIQDTTEKVTGCFERINTTCILTENQNSIFYKI